jgi:hypothetical protein
VRNAEALPEIRAHPSTSAEPDGRTRDLAAVQQGSKRYRAIAWLYLPSLWPGEAVAALASGLAAALAGALDVEASSVEALTSILTSAWSSKPARSSTGSRADQS